MKNGGKVVLLIVLLALVLLAVTLLRSCGKQTAELTAVRSPVKRLEGTTSQVEPVSQGSKRTMHQGDGVNVGQHGRAKLRIAGCDLEIFQASGLSWALPSAAGAPVCTAGMSHGTILASVTSEMILNTEWCVIRTLGTEFVVHLDPGRGVLWIIVGEGAVEVTTTRDYAVVRAGEQIWVWRSGLMEPVRPATRDEVGDEFPPLEELTDGAIQDDEWLDPVPSVEVAAELLLSLEQSTDEVIVGDCSGAHTVQIWTSIDGPPEVLAGVERAALHFRWEGIDERVIKMERVDDYTFAAEIAPFDYCCEQTTMVYTVRVFGLATTPLATESGKVLLTYCLG